MKNKKLRILNLYCGIGGNRKFWADCDVTAIEIDKDIASVYKKLFPQDNVFVLDAHQYLLDNYQDFDFIWASPPCQTHSRMRQFLQVKCRGQQAKYPDMKLYQEIIFLQNNFGGLWVVENVKPYYEPLIKPSFSLQRHYYWSNFPVQEIEFKKSKLRSAQILELQQYLEIDITEYKIPNKRQVLRNCVLPSIGQHILSSAIKILKGAANV